MRIIFCIFAENNKFMEKRDMLEALILYYSRGNKTHFANLLEVKPQTISSWISRNTFDAELIYSKCENVSADWLMTGSGQMLKNEGIPAGLVYTDPARGIGYKPATAPTGNMDTRCSVKLSADQSEGIPLIPFDAMAGALTSEQTVLDYECEHYIVPAFKGADFLITVKGDSMHPTYRSGDMVACKRVPMSDCFFQWNKAYVVDTDQGALIKRIKKASEKETLLLVSDNSCYDPIELPISAIHGVALVMGIIRLE